MAEQDLLKYDENSHLLTCKGNWDVSTLPLLQSLFRELPLPTEGEFIIDGAGITKMDSAGAWMLSRWINKLEKKGVKVQLQNFSATHQHLLDFIVTEVAGEKTPQKVKSLKPIEALGRYTVLMYSETYEYLGFIGKLTYEGLRTLIKPAGFRWKAYINVIYRTGYLALPIIALLSFMVGVIVSYQMSLQLINYGANIYVVDFLGFSILREFGPLITAIMVAGRTGSAFTAQLGMMKLNQEINALNTMGVTPAELLIIPRIIGLTIALPLLVMWSNIWGIFGGMVMAKYMLDINWIEFLRRFSEVIPLKNLIIGLGKTPIFAIIIATVGCFEGMRVEGGAESIGSNTTRSVVLAIFFIIVSDAAFSVLFGELKL